MNSDKVICTRHEGLVQYLIQHGFCDRDVPVVRHATPEDVEGKDVFGVLPLFIAAHARSVTEIPVIAGHKQEQVMSDPRLIAKYARPPRRYRVTICPIDETEHEE